MKPRASAGQLKLTALGKKVNVGKDVGGHVIAAMTKLHGFISDHSNYREEAFELATQFSSEIMFEEYIPGRELTVGILGNRFLPVLEIVPNHSLYDYECKYTEGMSEYHCPAKLDERLQYKIQKDALRLHNLLGCRHYSRVDFRLNEQNQYSMLEINTLPGMTSTSLLPKAANPKIFPSC